MVSKRVKKIIPPIISPNAVRRIIVNFFSWSGTGILAFPIGHPVTVPLGKIIHRCGPDSVILHAEPIGAGLIMGSVQIHPITKYMGLPIRDIFR